MCRAHRRQNGSTTSTCARRMAMHKHPSTKWCSMANPSSLPVADEPQPIDLSLRHPAECRHKHHTLSKPCAEVDHRQRSSATKARPTSEHSQAALKHGGRRHPDSQREPVPNRTTLDTKAPMCRPEQSTLVIAGGTQNFH